MSIDLVLDKVVNPFVYNFVYEMMKPKQIKTKTTLTRIHQRNTTLIIHPEKGEFHQTLETSIDVLEQITYR